MELSGMGFIIIKGGICRSNCAGKIVWEQLPQVEIVQRVIFRGQLFQVAVVREVMVQGEIVLGGNLTGGSGPSVNCPKCKLFRG